MPLPTKAYRDWVKEDLDLLLADPPAVETARLDFKADCKVLSGDKDEQDKARRDILKDVAAMANAGGGALLIGVRQSGKQGDPPIAVKIDGIPLDSVERLKQCMDGLIATHLDVRPGSLDYWAVPYQDDKVVLIVDVPANTYSLSMVTLGQLNQFWVRRGTDNRSMTTDEIQFRFGQLARLRAEATEELSRIRREQREKGYPIVWFAAVPVDRARDHIPVRRDLIYRLFQNSSLYNICPQAKGRSGTDLVQFMKYLAPSSRGVRYSHPNDEHNVFEIQRDGTVLCFHKLLVDERDGFLDESRNPCKASVIFLTRLYEPIMTGLCVLKDIQEQFALGKVAFAQSGLANVGGTVLATGDHVGGPYVLRFREPHADLDQILLDEHWSAKSVFFQWAKQIANAVEEERPIACPPWTPEG